MSEQKTEFRPRDRWLVFALLLGPSTVLAQLVVMYTLVPSACENGSKAMLHATTAGALLLALAAALIAAGIYRRFRGRDVALWEERTVWLAQVAFILAVTSMVFIVALEIPNLILRSCD